MAGSGLRWPDCGFKLDNAFLISDLLFIGGQFVNDFKVVVGLFNGGYRLGYVGSDEGSLLETAAWAEATWDGWTDGRKMVAFCNKAGPTDRFWATLRRRWALPAVAIGWVAMGTSTFPLVGLGVAKGKSPARWFPFLFLFYLFFFFCFFPLFILFMLFLHLLMRLLVRVREARA